jgi:predicted acyltransferase
MLIVLALCGALCVELGLLWHLAFPINKKLWTSSFVVLTSGLAMQLLVGCILLFDIRGWRRLARPFEIVGVNAIFVFVCSGLLSIALSRNPVAPPPIDLKVMQSLVDAKESQSRSRVQQNMVNSKFTEEETNAALDRLTQSGYLRDKKESGVDFYTPRIKSPPTGITYHGWLYRTLFTSRIHDPKLASLCMALLTVAFWWFVCWLMSLAGLAIRV